LRRTHGIHWRTINLAPNVAALAQAAWNQEPWKRELAEAPPASVRQPGAEGGAAASFGSPIADTGDDPLYQTVRYNLTAYRLPRANGSHRVKLQFCEPHYTEAGKRVFSVKLQGVLVIENLDIFGRVGQNRALDFMFEGIAVTNGWLDVEFQPVIEFPSIAALAIEGPGGRLALNCGGPAYRDYLADVVGAPTAPQRFAPTEDFYRDWATSEFGPEVAPAAARLFAKLDGRLPRPSDWTDGPGGLKPDPRPWKQVQLEYAFALQFEQLRPMVQGRDALRASTTGRPPSVTCAPWPGSTAPGRGTTPSSTGSGTRATRVPGASRPGNDCCPCDASWSLM